MLLGRCGGGGGGGGIVARRGNCKELREFIQIVT